MHLHVVDQVVQVVAQLLAGEGDLLVVGCVHEVKVVALAVEELHAAFIQMRLFELVVGTVGLGELDAGDHVAHFGTVQGLALARLGKIELGDDIGFAVNLNLQSLAQIGSGVHGGSPL